MNLLHVVFTVLMALPKFYEDTETPSARAERMMVLSRAIVSASDRATCSADWSQVDFCTPIWPASQERALALLLVTQGWWESRFSERVHADHCGPHECDATKLPGGVIFHRAKSPWQLQQTSFTPDWASIGGTSPMATYAAAWDAAKVLSAARTRCARVGDWDVGTISGYASGYTCQWSRSGARVHFFRQLVVGAKEMARAAPAPPVEFLVALRPAA